MTTGRVASLARAEIERVFREHYGRAVAVLIRLLGDIGAAEEAVQDAFLTAVQRWPVEGIPPSPAGWTAHCLEQAMANVLIRPDVRYVGPGERHLPH